VIQRTDVAVVSDDCDVVADIDQNVRERLTPESRR
jgi:hypothetical protein